MKYHCKTHGDWDANRESGCPSCVQVLRRQLHNYAANARTILAMEVFERASAALRLLKDLAEEGPEA